MKYSGYERKQIDIAKEAIEGGFDWDATTQGHAYWKEVCENLDKLLKE